jgi:hypothetical protein
MSVQGSRPPLNVDVEAVREAFGRAAGSPMVPHLDLRTGQVVLVPDARHPAVDQEDLMDPDALAVRNHPRMFCEIPRIAAHEDLEELHVFARQQSEPLLQARLLDALKQAHPAAVTLALLDRDDTLHARWMEHRARVHHQEALSWLRMMGLVAAEEPELGVTTTPPQAAPPLWRALLEATILAENPAVRMWDATSEARAAELCARWQQEARQLEQGEQLLMRTHGTRVEFRVGLPTR